MTAILSTLHLKAWAGKSRPALACMLSILCIMTASAHGDETDPPASGTIYPSIARFGILNTLHGVNIDDARVAIEMNINRQSEIGVKKVKPELEIVPDVATAAIRFRQKHLHGIYITGIDFILLREMVSTNPLYVASALTDTPAESYLLLTAKGIDWKRLAAMPLRRLMVEHSGQWDIGRIWLETELNRMRLPMSESFFTAIQAADKPTRQVLPVFFGQAEVCLVTESAYRTMVELNPQLGQKLQVIERSPGVIKSLFCVPDYLDPNFIAVTKERIHSMHLTKDGQQLMLIFRHKRFFPFRPEDLAATERILSRYRTMYPEFAKQYLVRHADGERIDRQQ